MNRRISIVIIISILGVLLFPGCVTEERWPRSPLQERVTVFAGDEARTMERFPSRYSIDPPFGEDMIAGPSGEEERQYPIPDETTMGRYDPFKAYSGQTYYGEDGLVTRHYYLDTGMGINIATLVAGQIEGLQVTGDPTKPAEGFQSQAKDTIMVWKDFLIDTRRVVGGSTTLFSNFKHGADAAADLMVVKTTAERLREVDDYLSNLQNEIPMIEIQVRVAELALSDSLQYGLSSIIDKITSGDAFLKGWLTNFNTETFKASGFSDFPGSLLSVGGIHDGLSLDAQIELLHRISDSEILSAPRITVLNGHRAVIQTGDQRPIVSPVFSGNQVGFSYIFKPTGVTLVIVPHLLPGGIIQIQVTAEVSAVTGEETIDLGTGPIQIPIISRRNIGTKLRVEDGKEFVLGGLYTYSDTELISKIPLLGDIPVIGLLFKSRSKAKAKSEILFHIVPRVVRGGGGLIDDVKEGR